MLFLCFYVVSGLGITVGYHRLFTHSSFKANRALRIGLAIAGSMAIEGPVIRWVADHRRHHAFSDHDGDPHSPWRYGESDRGAGQGPLPTRTSAGCSTSMHTNRDKYTPDLMSDRDIAIAWIVLFPLWLLVITSLALPAVASAAWCHDVLGRRAVGVLLGLAGAGVHCCTT